MKIKLTEKQIQVLELAVQGKKNREIAANMGITEATVKFHTTKILRTYKVKSKMHLIMAYAKMKVATGKDFHYQSIVPYISHAP